MTPSTTARPPTTRATEPVNPATAKSTTPHPTPWKTHVPRWTPSPKPTRHRTEPYGSNAGQSTSSTSPGPSTPTL
eukprot:1337289-Pyramimonas_sp.AAC.1